MTWRCWHIGISISHVASSLLTCCTFITDTDTGVFFSVKRDLNCLLGATLQLLSNNRNS